MNVYVIMLGNGSCVYVQATYSHTACDAAEKLTGERANAWDMARQVPAKAVLHKASDILV